MVNILTELGLKFKKVDAVDGRLVYVFIQRICVHSLFTLMCAFINTIYSFFVFRYRELNETYFTRLGIVVLNGYSNYFSDNSG